MEIIIKTLELLFSAFSFLTGYHLVRDRAPLARAAKRCALVMGGYWAVFLPRLVYLRMAGLTDIGKMTMLREALCLRNSVVPFAGYAGGFVLAVLAVLLLIRVPKVHSLLSVWLMVVMPVTAAGVIAYYAPALPELTALLGNLQLVMCSMGAGCVLAMWPLRALAWPRHVRAGVFLLALAGHYLLPQATVGALQLIGNRVSFTFDLDALYLPAICCALGRCMGQEQESARVNARGETAAPYFGRETTGVIKGVCVVMMFVHHFFTLPEWYVEGVAYPQLHGFAELMNLPLAACVPVFAFITGYFYAYRRERTLRYSLRKIGGVLNVYWIIQLLLFAVAAAGGAALSFTGFLWEMVGLESTVMLFNWYIAFYIMAMLMLPGLVRLPQCGPLTSSLALIGLPVLAATAVRALPGLDAHAGTAAQYMLDGVTGLGAGYIAARYGLFELLDRALGERRRVRLPLAAGLGLLAFFGRKYAPRLVIALPGLTENWALRVSMDVLYAPLLVYAMANLLPALPHAVRRVLGEMGRYALHMWLISCVFFNVSKVVYQPLLYLAKQPVLVTLWGLALCYAAARGVDALVCAVRGRCRMKKFS